LFAQYAACIDYLFPFFHSKRGLYIQCLNEAALCVKVVSHHLQLLSHPDREVLHRLDLFGGQQVFFEIGDQTGTLSLKGQDCLL
jgi:hypothetical protein